MKLHEGNGHVNLGSKLQSFERKWSSIVSTRKNLVEQRGQTVDRAGDGETGETGDTSLRIASTSSWLHSMAGMSGEEPIKSGEDHLSSSFAC